MNHTTPIKRSLSATLRMLTAVALVTGAVAGPAAAAGTTPAAAARGDIAKTLGFVPGFFRVMSDAAIPGAWQEMKGLQLNPGTALPGRAKELIGLAVAAQVPCKYCVIAHTEFAKLNGASEAEVAEAVAVGGLARHWSAYLYGTQIDEAKFAAEVARLVENAKKPAKAAAKKAQLSARR